MRRTNAYFVGLWPDPGLDIVTDATRPSNIWTRAVYYEGLMALYALDPNPAYYDYAVAWGESHAWGLRSGPTTRNADDQAAGQTYIDLYRIEPEPARIADIQASIDAMVASTDSADWTWIDAIQMSMPVFVRLGLLYGNAAYFEKAYDLYSFNRNSQGTAGLFNPAEGLWWRDGDFDPPFTSPNGEDTYWSRGNGWVVAALVRVLENLPADEPHRAEYESDLVATLEALRLVQRDDGFWNVSLHDPNEFGGPELTGTALHTFGMAFAVRTGLVDAATYLPQLTRAWNAMVTTAIRADGFLGYVQSTGKQPSDGQPVTADRVPDFEDYGLGTLLLAGSEIAKLAP